MRYGSSSLRKAVITYLVLALIFIALIFFFVKFNPLVSGDSKVALSDAQSTQNLNKEVSFPLRTETNTEVGKVKVVLVNAELRDEIVNKGKKATASEGKNILIINLRITNDNNKPISIQTKDFFRLTKNGKVEDLIAPEIHTDPVIVQPISTKPSRVGFILNESDKDLKLKVGEMNGEKISLDLNFN